MRVQYFDQGFKNGLSGYGLTECQHTGMDDCKDALQDNLFVGNIALENNVVLVDCEYN